jgi:hypothetical protein
MNVSWAEFARGQPELAESGRALLYQYGVGLAYIATVDRRGGPRVHPVCPLISDEGMFLFVVPSPKRADLHRDGRYALHSFATENNEDAFSIYGQAEVVKEPELRGLLGRQFWTERGDDRVAVDAGWDLFDLRLTRCLLTTTVRHGDPAPSHTSWRNDRQPPTRSWIGGDS